MGFYIEQDSKGNRLASDKAAHLLLDGAEECKGTPPWSPDLIVVLDNGGFQAVGWAYSREEYRRFLDPYDTRPKRVMRYPHIRTGIASARAYDNLREDFPNG